MKARNASALPLGSVFLSHAGTLAKPDTVGAALAVGAGEGDPAGGGDPPGAGTGAGRVLAGSAVISWE